MVDGQSLLLQLLFVLLEQRHHRFRVQVPGLVSLMVHVPKRRHVVGNDARRHLAKALVHAIPLSFGIRVNGMNRQPSVVRIGWRQFYLSCSSNLLRLQD